MANRMFFMVIYIVARLAVLVGKHSIVGKKKLRRIRHACQLDLSSSVNINCHANHSQFPCVPTDVRWLKGYNVFEKKKLNTCFSFSQKSVFGDQLRSVRCNRLVQWPNHRLTPNPASSLRPPPPPPLSNPLLSSFAPAAAAPKRRRKDYYATLSVCPGAALPRNARCLLSSCLLPISRVVQQYKETDSSLIRFELLAGFGGLAEPFASRHCHNT